MKRVSFVFLLLAVALTPSLASAKATITILNNDGAGTGFNDPKPVQPIGGNTGTTLGEQRLNSFKEAARIWGNILNSNVPIIVRANFSPIGSNCTGSSVVLGQARSSALVSNFPNAPRPNTLYPVALANALAGQDVRVLAGQQAGQADIIAQFNALVDNADCGTFDWYYGLDGNHGNNIDLVVVLLHEFAHGLGFSSGVTLSNGSELSNTVSIYETNTLDLTTGLHWDQMTNAQRQASALNTSQLVWDGKQTVGAARNLLVPSVTFTITSPSDLARDYDIGTAAFGPKIDVTALSGKIVAASDAAESTGTATDGCSTFSNGSDVRGNIALVDRGGCTFVTKAQNAQAAGARGVIIVDNTRDTCMPPGLGGDDTSVTIPVFSVNINDGAKIRTAAGNGAVNGMLRVDPSVRAGSAGAGFVRLYAPCTLSGGSSVHHWDVAATPNLLMEPFISDDLKPGDVDITVQQLMDIGWSVNIPLTASPVPSGRRNLHRGK